MDEWKQVTSVCLNQEPEMVLHGAQVFFAANSSTYNRLNWITRCFRLNWMTRCFRFKVWFT